MDIAIEIIKILVPLVVLPLVAVLAQELRRYLQARLSREQQEILQTTVETAVLAAEQLARTEVIQDRYRFAVERAREELAARGIRTTERDLETAVEATVISLRDFFLSLPRHELVD
jgi:hypothetical protein